MLPLADHNPIRHIRFAVVNWALMALCLAIFVAQVPWYDYAFTPATLHLAGGPKAPGGTAEMLGQMVSYLFLHATWLHLIGNLVVMWVFGDNIEDAMGHLRFPFFFILCGMAGAGTEALFTDQPQVPVIGASGAIAGLMGAYLLLHPRAKVLVLVALRVPVLVPAGLFVGLTVALDLISALSQMPGEVRVAFWAHIGGFVAGAALIPVMRKRDVPLFQPPVPHPEAGFFGAGRWLPDFGRDRPGGSRLMFWLKSALFFVTLAWLAESFLA